MFDFKVKSIINNYTVNFIENFSKSIHEQIIQGDVLIIDNKIIELYYYQMHDLIELYKCILINADENQKSYTGLEPIVEQLISYGFKKNNRLLAVGGGITQDVTGFISSILYRGVQWLFYPTTLLAQGDSCIGSKTSVNFKRYKNQLGGFYPPNKIFIDLNFLNSLKDRDIKSGLGEMCHYFIIAGQKDFERFKKEYHQALTNKKILSGLIARSLEIKKKYIEIDEFDQKERRIFNYGHSFGHALETLTNYEIPHGIAVSYGMDIANFISVKCGFLTEDIRNNIRDLLKKIWQGTSLKNITLDEYKNALGKDKKNIGNDLRLILNKGFGKIFLTQMKMDDKFSNWLQEYFKTQVNEEM